VALEFDEERIHSLGAYLRRVREEREITLEEVAAATRIHLRFLEAIEDDDDEPFPDPPYRDLFIKSYADFLGVPIEEVMLRLPERKPRLHTQKKARVTGKSQKVREPIKGAVEKEPPPPPPKKSSGHTTRILVYGGLVVVVIVVVAYFLFVSGKEKTYTMPVTTNISKPVQPSHDSLAQAPTMDSLYLLLIASRDTWLDVRADGQQLFSETLPQSDTVRFALEDSVYIKLGKANGVVGYLNGLPLRLGASSDSATAEFLITRNNYASFIDSSMLVE
jgi:transcriptional regulator with XRE-family HTH domain